MTSSAIRSSKWLRAILAVVLALSLNVPVLLGAQPSRGEPAAAILAAASQAAGIQANRPNQRFENSNQRNPVHSLFVLLAAGLPTPDRGRQPNAAEDVVLQTLSGAKRQSGRSPPYRIS